MPNGKYNDPALQAQYDQALAAINNAQSATMFYRPNDGNTGYNAALAQFKKDATAQLQKDFNALENPSSGQQARRNAVTSIEQIQSIDTQDIINDPFFGDYLTQTGSRQGRVVTAPTKSGDAFFTSRGRIAPIPGDERELIMPDYAVASRPDPMSQLPNTTDATRQLYGSQPRPQYQGYQQAQLDRVQQLPWQNPALDPNQMISDRSINEMQTVYGNDPFAFVNRIDQTGINAQKNSIGYVDQLLRTPYQTSAFGTNPYAFSSGVDQTGKNMQVQAGNYFGSVLGSPAMRSEMANKTSAFQGLQSDWRNVTSAFGDDPFDLSRRVDQTGVDVQKQGIRDLLNMPNSVDPDGINAQKEGLTYLRGLLANNGQDAVSQAHYEQMLAESDRTRAANTSAALAQLDRQGQGSGGLSLMAQVEGANQSMAQQFNASLEARAMEQQRRDAANQALMVGGNQLRGQQFGEAFNTTNAAITAGFNLRAQQFGEAALSAQQIDALRAMKAQGLDNFAIAKAAGLDQFTVARATAMDQMAMYDQQRRLAAAQGLANTGATLYGQELNAAIAAAGGIDAMFQSEAARRDMANVQRAQMGYNLRNQQASEVFHAADSIDQMTAARANLMAQIDDINSGRVYTSSETYQQYQRQLAAVNAQIQHQEQLYNVGTANQETYSQNRYGEQAMQNALAQISGAMQADAGRTVAVLSTQMGLDAQQQANFINALQNARSADQQQQIIDAQLRQQGVSAADIAGILAPVGGALIGGAIGGPAGAYAGGALGGAGAALFGGNPSGMSTVPTISQAYMPQRAAYQPPPVYAPQPRAGNIGTLADF